MKDTLDYYEEEADYLVRLEACLTNMIGNHRISVMRLLEQSEDRETTKRLIKMYTKTDFKGYFRDKAG